MEEINITALLDYLDHKGDPASWDEVWTWINASEDNRREFYYMKEIYACRNTHLHSSHTEVESMVRIINEIIDKRSTVRRQRRILTFVSSAAALLAIALVSVGIVNYTQKYAWQTITTGPLDKVKHIELGDGTTVFLDKSSELSYRNNSSSRKRIVKLQGNAYFDVVTDTDRTFIVDAGKMKIKVIGTSFNVKTWDVVETVLEKGCVAILNPRGEQIAGLNPGQRAIFCEETGEVVVDRINTTKYTSWRFEKDVFEEITFAEITTMIESRYSVSVLVDTNMFDNRKYRLVINSDETLENLMQILEYIIPLDYYIQGDQVIIKPKK